MKFLWIITILIALFVAARGGFFSDACPAGFERTDTLCTVERPVHGTCPDLSKYDVGLNRCVYVARF